MGRRVCEEKRKKRERMADDEREGHLHLGNLVDNFDDMMGKVFFFFSCVVVVVVVVVVLLLLLYFSFCFLGWEELVRVDAKSLPIPPLQSPPPNPSPKLVFFLFLFFFFLFLTFFFVCFDF